MAKASKVRIAAGAIAAAVLCAGVILTGLTIYGKYQMGKIPGLTFEEALQYTTKDTPDAVITVGVIHNGQASWQVYGENGTRLPAALHTYEIGSLTKTFTAALVSRAAAEGKLSLDDTIDRHLPLPGGQDYPSIKELLTHTSGYKAYYFELPMISNHLNGRNDFYGVTRDMVLGKAGALDTGGNDRRFVYSNYGYALLGLVLEAVYGADYPALANGFAQDELGLADTKISDKSGDLGHYWDWKDTDAYLAAGGLTSNISDMLSYAQMQLEDSPYFSACHSALETIDASTPDYRAMDINMDEIGMSWIIDRENGIIWHNGGTGNYNSYLGFRPETGTAVVVLSNLAPGRRIPATVLGTKRFLELDGRA